MIKLFSVYSGDFLVVFTKPNGLMGSAKATTENEALKAVENLTQMGVLKISRLLI